MWQRPKYMRNCFTVLEMALEFDIRLEYVRNDVSMWEMAYVLKKRQKYVGKDVDMFEWLKYERNGLSICQMA